MSRAALCCLLLLAACAGSRGEGKAERAPREGEGSALRDPRAPRGGPASVRGTVLDAASGRPLAGALVQGPGGAQAVSDREGRFALERLPVGGGGEVVATTDDGRSGTNRLRALREGVLEVVVFVR